MISTHPVLFYTIVALFLLFTTAWIVFAIKNFTHKRKVSQETDGTE